MSTAATSYCVKCGYRIDGGLQFCPQCGEAVRQGATPASPDSHYRWMDDGGGRQNASPEPRPAPPQQWAPPPAQPYQPPPRPQYAQPYSPSTQHVVHHHQIAQQPSSTPSAAMGIGIAALSFMIVGLIPCLGWLNYLTIFLGIFSGTFSLICIFIPKFAGARGKLLIGLIFGFAAFFIGLIRLILGGGCL